MDLLSRVAKHDKHGALERYSLIENLIADPSASAIGILPAHCIPSQAHCRLSTPSVLSLASCASARLHTE